jgi:hypothetical protein
MLKNYWVHRLYINNQSNPRIQQFLIGFQENILEKNHRFIEPLAYNFP